MASKPNSLFHFTKSLDVLKLILSNGVRASFSKEYVKIFDAYGLDPIFNIKMACFCDIPLGKIDEHVAYYGEYGIGFTREWGGRSNIHPVCYVLSDSPMHKLLDRFVQTYYNNEKQIKVFSDTVSLMKITTSEMDCGDKSTCYHQESEWRFVPNIEQRNDYIRYNVNDVRYIFVSKRNELVEIVNYIYAALDNFSHEDKLILCSKVISIEDLMQDM